MLDQKQTNCIIKTLIRAVSKLLKDSTSRGHHIKQRRPNSRGLDMTWPPEARLKVVNIKKKDSMKVHV